jgi:hypothetical protein
MTEPKKQSAVFATLCSMTMIVVGCGTSPEFVDEPADPSHETVPDVEDAPKRGSVIGRWTGVGHQTDGSSWDVVLSVAHTNGGACAVISYPTVECGGYWECGESDGREIVAVEHITYGRERCADRVDVRVSLGHDGRSVAFQAQAGKQAAVANLTPR